MSKPEQRPRGRYGNLALPRRDQLLLMADKKSPIQEIDSTTHLFVGTGRGRYTPDQNRVVETVVASYVMQHILFVDPREPRELILTFKLMTIHTITCLERLFKNSGYGICVIASFSAAASEVESYTVRIIW